MNHVEIASLMGDLRSLFGTAKELGMTVADRCKFVLSYYGSRRRYLAAVTPSRLRVKLNKFRGAVAVLRPNGVDYKVLAEIFVKNVYAPQVNGVGRVLDLGANIGISTLFLWQEFPQAEFACVEPFPDNCSVLRDVVSRNHIRATVFEAAIGAESGQAELYLSSDPTCFSVVPADAHGQQLTVPQLTVPDLLARLGWQDIDVLKIDIEGYEKTLFQSNNGWLRLVKSIMGEAHGHVGYGIEELRADLEPFGFRVTSHGFDSRNGMTIFEAHRN